MQNLNSSAAHVLFLFYCWKVKKVSQSPDKRNQDVGTVLSLDDVIEALPQLENHQFNYKWFGQSNLVDLKSIGQKISKHDTKKENKWRYLHYILFRIFIQNPNLENIIPLSPPEEEINNQLLTIFYKSELTKMYPRFYDCYLKLKPNNSIILSSGHMNIESILLNWANLIISKQVAEYKKYIGDNSLKETKFERMSQRIIESISHERRKAVLVVKDLPQEHLAQSKPEMNFQGSRFKLLFEHSKCTDKIKACSRCKEIDSRKQQIKNPKVSKDIQDFFNGDINHDISEIRGKKHK